MHSLAEKLISCISEVLDWVGRIDIAYKILVIVIILLSFVVSILLFRRRINKLTREQINRFIQSGKYLPDVNVEFNDELDGLRYYLHAFRWKKRIIRQYNSLFKGYVGKRFKQLVGNSCKLSLPYFASFKRVRKEIVRSLKWLNEKSDDSAYRNNKFIPEEYIVRSWANTYAQGLRRINSLMEKIDCKNAIIVGSAGNGKTNLACRLAEIAIKNRVPCLLINARDIDCNCVEYIKSKMPVSPRTQKHIEAYLHFTSVRLLFHRKYFLIVIDAVNENDHDFFSKSIGSVYDYFQKYKRIKVLMTCRSEYYSLRSATYFHDTVRKPAVYSLNSVNYDDRAFNRMLALYSEHFNVHCQLSSETKRKLCSSLLLMRIFFEVNKDCTPKKLELRNAKIYQRYFEKIEHDNPNVGFKTIVNRIAEYMLSGDHDYKMDIEKLNLSNNDLKAFRDLLDNNLIISHTVEEGIDITKRRTEYVYFVFDDFRDFCFARYLLVLGEESEDSSYSSFFRKVEELFAAKQSPIEGILKYGYHYFREKGECNFCTNILSSYGHSNVQSIADRNRLDRRYRELDNYGLSLIFSECSDLLCFELDYLYNSILIDNEAYWDVFWLLLGNDCIAATPNTKFLIDMLLQMDSVEIITNIITWFFSDRHDYYYSVNKRRIDYLRDYVDWKDKMRDSLPVHLKSLITLMSACHTSETITTNVYSYVDEESVKEYLFNMIKCREIIDKVNNFILESKSRWNYHNILSSFLEGNGCEI